MRSALVQFLPAYRQSRPRRRLSPPACRGMWSIVGSRNCECGPAWVFLADGCCAGVPLPDKGFAANETNRVTVEERTEDQLVTLDYRGLAHNLHRCPEGSSRASAVRGEH